VIAAVQANAMGGGLEFALVCDLIVLDAEARAGLPEVRLGLIPGGGGTQRLRERVGAARAKRMMMLGSALSAEEALACGLVDLIAAAGKALLDAHELAGRVAMMPAVAVEAIKRAVDEPGYDALQRGLASERSRFADAFASEDFREGYSAFLAKRRPQFVHR
jgi:enoyl-CoA hydratase